VPEYTIAALAERLPHSVAVNRREQIVLLAYLDPADPAGPLADRVGPVVDKVEPVLSAIGCQAGVSDWFAELASLRAAHKKACVAVETGRRLSPDASVYRFAQYALAYMLRQARGSFRLEDLVPVGLERLIRHDEAAASSYVETLRCLLDCEMNIARAARLLYLHRSSLVQRCDRIFRLLGTRLESADERLHYGMLLRLLSERR
jgi:DNA-binding PucR family transcriptional regulator